MTSYPLLAKTSTIPVAIVPVPTTPTWLISWRSCGLSSADGDFWTVGEKISGTGGDTTVELPAQPARCDAHSFGSATGGTTFFVNVTLEGEPAQIRLAMSPEVTGEALAYAAEVCGF